jgi:hypothetical protein
MLLPGVQRVEHVPVRCYNHAHEQAVEGTHSHMGQNMKKLWSKNICAALMLLPGVQGVEHVPVRCHNHTHEQAVEGTHSHVGGVAGW